MTGLGANQRLVLNKIPEIWISRDSLIRSLPANYQIYRLPRVLDRLEALGIIESRDNREFRRLLYDQ